MAKTSASGISAPIRRALEASIAENAAVVASLEGLAPPLVEGAISNHPVAAINVARAHYALGDDSSTREWIARSVALLARRLTRLGREHNALRIDWHDLEILGAAYLTDELAAITPAIEAYGFAPEGAAPYRHWSVRGQRVYQMLRGQPLASPSDGARADAVRWKHTPMLDLPEALLAGDATRVGELLALHLESLGKDYSAKRGPHSFLAGAICKRLGAAPPLADTALARIPSRLSA